MRMFTLFSFILMAGCATSPRAQTFDTGNPSPDAEGYTHYLAGVLYQRNGRFEDAAREFREASDLLPDSVGLNIRLVQFYIDVQDFKNAEVMCKRVIAEVPNDASLWIVLATLYQQQDKPEEAADAVQKAMELKPNSLEDFEGLLRIGELSNDRITTIDVLKKLTDLIPTSPELYLRLGMSLARIDNNKEAAAALERALELDPTRVQARSILGIVYLQQDKNKEAAEQFRLFLEKNPDDNETREFLAGALARMQQYPEAAGELQKIFDGGKPDPIDFLEQAYLLMRCGRMADANKIVPPSDAPFLGTVFRAMARKGAGEEYKPVVESLDKTEGDLDTECTEFLNGMLYLFGDKDMGEFLLASIQSMNDDGVHSKTLNIIAGRTLMSLDRNEEAAQVLESTLKEFGPDKWVYYYLGTVYDSLDRFNDAEKSLRTCLQMDPTNPETMNNLAYMYAEHNTKLDEAEKLLKQALEITPDSGYYLDSLGWVYYRKGEADLAIEYIRRAIMAMDHDDAILRDHLGDAYLLKGEVEKAVGEWQRAKRLDPDIEGVQEKIDAHTPQKKST